MTWDLELVNLDSLEELSTYLIPVKPGLIVRILSWVKSQLNLRCKDFWIFLHILLKFLELAVGFD